MNRYSYILLCFLLYVQLTGCGNKSHDTEVPAIKVKTIVLADTSGVSNRCGNRLVRTYMGIVEEASNASLSFTLGGQVTNVAVSEGDKVKKGQRLICVDDTEARASLTGATAQLEQARDAYNRVRSVYEKGGVSEVKWVEVQTKLAQAQSLFDMAHQTLSGRVITAPFDGVVGEVKAAVGDNLLPGQPVIKVLDVNNLCVTFYVPESEIRLLNVGEKVSVECGSLNRLYSASVQDKSMIANQLTHSYKVRLKLDKPDSDLLSGMNCKVRVNQQNMSGYVVPGSAVQTYQDGLYCWIVDNGIARRVFVKPSAFVNDGVVISSGITKGDEVVVAGYQKLYNGVRVEVE